MNQQVSDEKQNILLVDDRPENLLVLESILESPDMNLIKTTSGNEALGLILERDYALVLLDVQMPDMDGFETAELLRGPEKTKHIPIIFVTAISKDQEHIFKGYESGAVDFLFKPIEPEILRSKVRIFCELHKQKIIIQKQLSEITQLHTQLQETANHDALTGALNRGAILEIFQRELARSKREETLLSVMIADLDFFKKVNDTVGHLGGDAVLKECVNRIITTVRTYDVVGRYGGEEFLIIVPDCDRYFAYGVAERIQKIISSQPVLYSNYKIPITVSIGVSDNKNNYDISMENIIDNADQSLYQAKREGRNRIFLFEEERANTKTTEEKVNSPQTL